MSEPDFIKSLVQEHKAVQRSLAPSKMFVIWTVLNSLFLFIAITWSGSLRPGWQSELMTNYRFLLEFLLGVAISTISGYFIFKHSLPETKQADSIQKYVPFLLLATFSGLMLLSILWPTISPSNLGHRPHCLQQMLGFSIPPLLILLYHLGRSAPVNIIYVGSLAGIAAAAPFATAMHLACMYEPSHILIYHVLPVLVVAILAAIAAKLLIHWWR